jgi:hypothetical protein
MGDQVGVLPDAASAAEPQLLPCATIPSAGPPVGTVPAAIRLAGNAEDAGRAVADCGRAGRLSTRARLGPAGAGSGAELVINLGRPGPDGDHRAGTDLDPAAPQVGAPINGCGSDRDLVRTGRVVRCADRLGGRGLVRALACAFFGEIPMTVLLAAVAIWASRHIRAEGPAGPPTAGAASRCPAENN